MDESLVKLIKTLSIREYSFLDSRENGCYYFRWHLEDGIKCITIKPSIIVLHYINTCDKREIMKCDENKDYIYYTVLKWLKMYELAQ